MCFESDVVEAFESAPASKVDKVDDAEEDNNKSDSTDKPEDWVNETLLEDILTRFEDSAVEVNDYNVRAAVGVGDNYLSIIYRVYVRYMRTDLQDTNEKQLIIKGLPGAQFLIEFIEDLGIFTKELAMYYDCLPTMKNLMNEYMPEESTFIAPYAYHCSRPNTVVLEDLTESGYRMADRRKQLDLEHCTTTLRTLARFHALSAKIHDSNPEMIQSVSSEFYAEENREKLAPICEKTLGLLADEISGWGEHAYLSEGVRSLSTEVFEKLLKLAKPTPGMFSVLNHGDFWANNMMFKYDNEGKVEHVMIIDFQLARYASPTMDLIYFFFTSTQSELITDRMYDLVKLYHEALSSDLEKLGLDPGSLTLEQLEEDIRAKGYFAFFVISNFLPLVIAKPSDAVNLEKLDEKNEVQDEHPLLKNYRDNYYRETAGKLLAYLDRLGFLDAAKEFMPDSKREKNENEEVVEVEE